MAESIAANGERQDGRVMGEAAAPPPPAPLNHQGAAADVAAGWSLARRIGFRFAFAYVVLYCLPFPLGYIPEFEWMDRLVGLFAHLQRAVTPWVAVHVLHLTQPVLYQPTGSGDTLAAYVWSFCLAVAAAVATAVWTVLDHRRADYQRLHPWLRLYLRYWLAWTLLSYGMAKVIQTQFPTPSVDRLEEPLGQFSPMGLLWTFMGYSTPYNVFAGGMEALGGVLLFFRRTTTLGALFTMAVIGNVVLLNFCYDVPVKLFALHLLVAAAFLAAADARRLANVLLLNRPAAGATFAPYSRRRWLRIAAMVLKTAFVGYALYANTTQSLDGFREMHPTGAAVPPFTGTFAVDQFVADGQIVPADAAHPDRWSIFAMRGAHFLTVRMQEGPKQGFRATFTPRQMTLERFGKPGQAGQFAWSRPDPTHVLLQGTLEKKQVVIKGRLIPERRYPLMTRGFHWIQELPFNR